MPTKSLQIRCRRVLYLVRVTKDESERNSVAGKSGDGKRIQLSKKQQQISLKTGGQRKEPLYWTKGSVVLTGPLSGER